MNNPVITLITRFKNRILDLVNTNKQLNTAWTIFLDNPRIALLAILTAILMGGFALININIEANPEVNQPAGIIQTIYPNSSPTDVEAQVTEPIEQEIANLDQLKTLESVSSSNLSSITATFESSADPDEVLDQLREAVSNVGNLPDDAETPQVIEFDFNNQPIVTLSVAGNLDSVELSNIAEDVSDEIKQISGVAKTELSGNVEQIVQIKLDPVKLDHYQVSIAEIVQAINTSNLNLPLGEISENNSEINLRLVGKASELPALNQIPIRNLSSDQSFTILTLAQLAKIELNQDKTKTQSFVNDSQPPANPAVSMNVFKSSGGNIVNIVDRIDQRITELNKELPGDTKIIKTNDNAYFIRNDLRTLSISGLQTIVIIFFALLVFLTIREAFVAAIAIPLIFLITFATIYFTDQTLNSLTIFSLILSLGLIVDTSIVIVEGIHDNRREGQSRFESAKNSIATFRWPLVAGTLTTVAAFFPMLLVSGIVGDFIKTIPIVLTITLAASLFVSLAFSPLIASRLLKDDENDNHNSFRDQMIDKVRTTYQQTLTSLLNSTFARAVIVLITILLFLASLTLPFFGILKPQLFPVVDTPFFYINIEAPLTSTLSKTRQLAKPVETILTDDPYVKNYVLNLGRKLSTDISFGNNTTSPNYGSFIVNLSDAETDRPRSYKITEAIRNQIDQLNTPLDIKIEELSSGPPTAAPLEARITGPDLNQLKQISDQLKQELSQIDGLINLSSEFDDQPNEAILKFNQERLSYYGLTNQQASLIIQSLTTGVNVGTISINSEDYDTKVYLGQANVADIRQVLNLSITTPKGQIPVSYIATITTEPTLQTIPHLDQERTVRVRGFTETDVLISELLPTIEQTIAATELPSSYNIETGGEDEDIQQSFTELFSSMIIAIILILVILTAIFNSFRQTFIVLMTIPLAIIGIFPGLAALGLPLSFPAFLGIVMLTGIVVNDAIVLIDQINNNRQQIPSTKTAIIEGARSRLTPILLTSITTIFGLLPITIKDEFWRGLGFSVIFGMITATFLTLFIIPTLYSFFFRDKKRPH